jgi:hypothetical protein
MVRAARRGAGAALRAAIIAGRVTESAAYQTEKSRRTSAGWALSVSHWAAQSSAGTVRSTLKARQAPGGPGGDGATAKGCRAPAQTSVQANAGAAAVSS